MIELNASNLKVDIIARPVSLDQAVPLIARRPARGEIVVEVRTVGLGTDRDYLLGWGLGPNHGMLAARLRRAILAGKVFGPGEIRTDIHGKTYVCATSRVLGRTLNADLRRMGF